MARLPAAVRDAVTDDLPDLVALWAELRETAGRFQLTAPHATEAGVLARLRQVQEDPQLRVLVASMDGAIAGMAVVHAGPVSPLVDELAVSVDFLHVFAERRRRGVGSSLLAAVAEWADALGAEQVVTSVSPGERDVARFYARLGFGPTMVRRAVSTSTLRRTLSPDPRAVSLDVVSRRRLGRVRTAMPRTLGR